MVPSSAPLSARSGRRATLATIAQAAGVSLPTVSKVLNGKDDVAPATRARVQELLTQYDYVPVGGRRVRDDVLVDLVFGALDSPWAIELIRGVTDSSLDVVVSAMSGRSPRQWVDHLVGSGRRGAILVTSQLSSSARRSLERAALPLVLVDPVDLPDADLPSVGATNWAGGLAATRHLVELGHRRIGMIGGPGAFLCSRARIDGYGAALEQAGLPVDPTLVRHGDFHHEGGFRAALALLELPNPPTALFAGSDEQAMGALEAARSCGLRVPDDLSIVGFDDLPVARWCSPPLTTVRQPLAEMGRLAARMLKDLIDRVPLESRRIELATTLVVRSTTAPPRAAR